jgi:hypothetical protein
VKYARSLERSEEAVVLPEMTDAQLDEAIKGNGQKVTEETRKSMREMMNRSIGALNSAKITGSSAETHVQISSPELNKADFQFVLPKDAVMKDSLFDSVLSGGK